MVLQTLSDYSKTLIDEKFVFPEDTQGSNNYLQYWWKGGKKSMVVNVPKEMTHPDVVTLLGKMWTHYRFARKGNGSVIFYTSTITRDF